MSQAVQLQIEDFLKTNEQELSNISVENPELFYSVFQVLDFVNSKFGRGEPLPKFVAVPEAGKKPEVVTIDTHTGEVSTETVVVEPNFKEKDFFVGLSKNAYCIKLISDGKVIFYDLEGLLREKPISEINENISSGAWRKTSFDELSKMVDLEVKTGIKFKSMAGGSEIVLGDLLTDHTFEVLLNNNKAKLTAETVFFSILFGVWERIGITQQVTLPAASQAKVVKLNVGEVYKSNKDGKFYEIIKIHPNDMVEFEVAGRRDEHVKFYQYSFLRMLALDEFEKVENIYQVGDIFKSTTTDNVFEIKSIRSDGYVDLLMNDEVSDDLSALDVKANVLSGLWQKIGVAQEKAEKPEATTLTTSLPSAGSAATEPEAVMTIQELKDAIAGLELIADFDDEAKEELKKLKAELKQLKKKKA